MIDMARDRTDIYYAGPAGRERDGEHWNARIIREEAEQAATLAADAGALATSLEHDGYQADVIRAAS